MKVKEPTFEEYKKATAFARFRYKYGVIIMVLCWLCLIFICIYLFIHLEEITTNPLIYGAKTFDVNCMCYGNNGMFFVNGSTISKNILS